MVFAMYIFAIIISLFLVVLSLYFRYNRHGRLLSKIPGPRKLPIIGSSYTMIKSEEEDFFYLRTLNKKYGDVIGFRALNISLINIYNPDDIKKILSSDKYNEKQKPYNFLRPWLGEGLLTSNGIKWHKRRKMLTQAFHFNILKKYAETFAEHTADFMKLLKKESEKEKSDVLKLISNMTLKIMCETTMGISMKEGKESVSNKYFDALYKLGNIIHLRSTRLWLFFDFTFQFTKLAKIQNKVLKDLHFFTRNVITERKEYLIQNSMNDETSEKGHLAMLDLLIQNESNGKIDIEGIREEVDTFVFEGHDTTATTLTFFLMIIANEPLVQDKLYEEINRILGDSDGPATCNDLNQMKYMECCIKESLRLYPIIPYIARYLNEDTTLGGYTVPSGTIVAIHIFDLHHREDTFPDPERFIPERFMSDDRHPFSYLPFSAGLRNCIGQKFAMLEMKMLISSILRSYRLEPVTKHSDLIFITDIVLRTSNSVYVRFRPRQ